ncbi:MAG: crossover junction endodeoxyribonuclease RuvC [Myxococcales bacterium]|jgi:crossover junction endodeoxyribonuclease RuvC|nr:crossover junction endodeoxyribonuclease RuvC [Myxococcales bacterium]
MRILGIDPGTQYLGAGIVEREGSRVRHVAHALLTPKDFDTLPDKLAYLFDGLTEIIEAHRPEVASIETVFHGKNAHSAIVLAHARGVALLAAARADLPVFEYAPAQVKRAVGASGSAAKEVVTRLVCSILALETVERADCADALAVALCHLNHAAPLVRPSVGYRIVRRDIG